MSDYTKTTDFLSKDTLLSGDPNKTVLGAEIDTEFDNIATAIATKSDSAGTLAQFAATTSAQLAGVLSDETGSGAAVFANTPTLVTPVLGTPTSGTLTNCTGLPAAGVSGTALVAADIGVSVQAYDATYLNDADIGVSVQPYDADTPTVAASQAEMEVGTEAALRSMSPLRVAQAIAALGGSGGGITLGTAVASTSGTSIDFTSIPSGTKRITINFAGVSTNGTSNMLVQLGDSGGIENTGYISGTTNDNGTRATSTAGFIIQSVTAAGDVMSGRVTLELLNASTFKWVSAGQMCETGSGLDGESGGSKSLSAELDRVRITTVGGTATFDAGEINITYES